MRRSAQLAEKETNSGNGAQRVFRAKKSQSDDRTSNIVTMDNGTMVEALKYLNYCQLAKKSLVSKRFRDLIQTHRHSLALLYVDAIGMTSYPIAPVPITIFDKMLTSEAYNEWVILNGYSKQAPLRDQLANTQNTQNIPNAYQLYAYAHYKDPSRREWNDKSTVFDACAELNAANWPVFQHFVRLITDPFIYINRVHLAYQNDDLNLFTGAINSDHNRLHCNRLDFDLMGNSHQYSLNGNHQYITWAKDHIRCNQFSIYGAVNLSQEALLDFAMTAGQCTSLIIVDYNDISKAMIDFVQKFLELENWDEYQGVLSIRSSQDVKNKDIQALKSDYAEFLVKKERDNDESGTTYAFEFANNAIGKKLQLPDKIFDDEDDHLYFGFPVLSLEIKNL